MLHSDNPASTFVASRVVFTEVCKRICAGFKNVKTVTAMPSASKASVADPRKLSCQGVPLIAAPHQCQIKTSMTVLVQHTQSGNITNGLRDGAGARPVCEPVLHPRCFSTTTLRSRCSRFSHLSRLGDQRFNLAPRKLDLLPTDTTRPINNLP